MSRKNPFADLDVASIADSAPTTKPGYGMTGAAKTVVRSIEEMVANTKKLMEGETIVELDPQSLDVSFVADRLTDKDEEYEELKRAIEEYGQLTPILVRPHPSDAERYMVVFGHRRALVAKELGINVKAVVKTLDDITSVVAQGQENSARSNLSFIERAYFAKNLLSRGMSKDVIKTALGIDDAMLSKMLSVIEAVPAPILTALGASKKIGRDKWLSLRQIILRPAYLDVALGYIARSEFMELAEDKRFDDLHDYLKRYRTRSTARSKKKSGVTKSWQSDDEAVSFAMTTRGKKVAIEMANAEALPFSEWLSQHLDRLYEDYRGSKTEK